jgi:thymidylate kinase
MKKLISFIGIDGSGKSTLAKEVFEELRKSKCKTRLVYGRYQPLIVKYIMVVGRKLFLDNNKNTVMNYDMYLENKQHIFQKNAIITKLYIKLIIFEYYLQLLVRIILPYKLGYTIISDRYVYDTVINDIAIDLRLSVHEAELIIKGFWKYIPRPDITFLVQVPEEIAIKRKTDIPSLSYLKIRNNFYRNIAPTENNIFVVDGTQSLDILKTRIFNKL